MRIILYTCNAENNRVDKSDYLSNPFQIEGVLREPSSVINPEITIEKTNPAKYNYNYMHIPEFNRWYYINNIEAISNKLWKISAKVDVLYSWRDDISSSKAVISKSEEIKNANMYLDDGGFIMDSRKYNNIIPFENGFTEDGKFILICAGGE